MEGTMGTKVKIGLSGSMFLKTKENKFNKTIPSKNLNNYLIEKLKLDEQNKKEKLIRKIMGGQYE